MCLIEKYFAFASINLDREEKIKGERDAIFAIGMLLEPKRTLSLLKQIELEESVSDEEKRAIKKDKMKLNEYGKVESDPEIRKLIKLHNERNDNKMYQGRQNVSIETLNDMIEKEKNANE